MAQTIFPMPLDTANIKMAVFQADAYRTTDTFTTETGRHILITSDGQSGYCGLFAINTGTGGTVTCSPIAGGDSFTIDTNTAWTLKMSNSTPTGRRIIYLDIALIGTNNMTFS